MTLTIPSTSFLAEAGQDVNLFPVPSELTIAQAAKFLGMRERRLNDILDAGKIAFRLENGERLLSHNILLDYKQMQERREAALDEMVRLDQEMGLYDD